MLRRALETIITPAIVPIATSVSDLRRALAMCAIKSIKLELLASHDLCGGRFFAREVARRSAAVK
jgi:hypothetical protein